MKDSVLTHGYIWLFAAVVVGLMLAMPQDVSALKGPEMGKLQINITNDGIKQQMTQPKEPGIYVVSVKNDTCVHRGIVMKGLDKGGSRYVRYTNVLGPGKNDTFRWYFPGNRNVRIRDLMTCTHRERSCVVASFGLWEDNIRFAGLTG